ncbi:Cyanovirin-N [Penicillium hispanicum]|uniref:Cyanovirin-N n=1 Tax=Penicillium hispanicum TaxID=1080232 RepID=UPI00253FBADB|nr:Cyanovirin-N [Penicillium hispanicum]KAJ5586718.1 Cyanovirin-N [Penicillium hispanicum]
MSFHTSAVGFDLHDDHILRAILRNEDDEEQESELDLNTIIGNENGEFSWGGENFQASATSIELHGEGDEGIPVLRALLGNLDGEEVPADINLAERIGNDNGNLVFV